MLAPVIVRELSQGARSEQHLAKLRRKFSNQPMLAASPEIFICAGELYARLCWQDVTVRSPHDCLIAALAVEHDVPLLALDRDFRSIAVIEPRLTLAEAG